ncbi:HNH endonuclease [Oligoflexus tunisiensis]|uniref:HNH endonuclease n=1 Tax=Oligoflexus tunisiensis TaxID=708132 RepID=UPI00114CB457|nr:HNH endonuclease signature motif containing protein [Oligoflexus tunisiensis]
MKDPNLMRKETLDIADVLPHIRFTPKELSATSFPEALVMIAGDPINMTSLKLQTFKENGTRCRICGCKGQYFAKEKYAGEPYFHLNLYALKEGREVLMTKDHIIPLDKGGRDRLNNFQTLCMECNRKKGNRTADKVKKNKLKKKSGAKDQKPRP